MIRIVKATRSDCNSGVQSTVPLLRFRSMTRTIEWLCIPQTIVLIVWSWTVSVSAQIVPDSSLPVESRIVPNGSILSIDGGTTAGTNLFHSFSEFSVPTGTEAAFNNALTIDNIITRVTGGNISKIDGLIRANGSANLFLLNPNGIVFGENAQLAIGGSFFGSTAESLRFADGFEFSSVAPEANPILTVSVPVGLQMGDNPGAIVNRSQATTLNPLPSNSPLPANRGLEVAPGRTLALIGGNIALENGNLTALQGEIQLASFASSGLVTFSVTPTRIALDDSNIDRFGNIDISGASTLNVTGLGSGAIGLHGGEINIRDDANLLAVTLGNIDGRGIEITGDRFRMQDSVLVSTIAFGAGNAGDVTIRTAESVELSGLGFPALQELLFRRVLMGFDLNTLDFGIFTNAQGGGKAGTLSMATGSLTMNEGALIGSSTNGSAPGGDIILQAETMALEEAVVASATLVGSTGNAGDIVIEVGDIKLVDGGYITASSLGSGASGDIIVRADTVEARGLPPGTLTGFSTNSASNRVLSSNRAGNI